MQHTSRDNARDVRKKGPKDTQWTWSVCKLAFWAMVITVILCWHWDEGSDNFLLLIARFAAMVAGVFVVGSVIGLVKRPRRIRAAKEQQHTEKPKGFEPLLLLVIILLLQVVAALLGIFGILIPWIDAMVDPTPWYERN